MELDLEDYALGDELGRGAMGVVYAATHRETGAGVALKVVRTASERARAALENEVLAMARLNHPSLLYLYDYGFLAAGGRSVSASQDLDRREGVWMAVERASGGSLEDWFPDSWAALEPVLDAVFAGLAHAHARGMVHRDLKPANLLRATPRDHRPGLKIADFGLAVLRERSGVMRGGTPLYMPPEQQSARHGETGPWSDIYALGAMVWHLVCGRPLFVGDVDGILHQHVHAPLPDFRPSFPVPDALEPTLRHMLAKAPGRRPRTVHAVRAALAPQRSVGLADQGVGARLPGIGASLLPLRQWRVVGRRAERQALLDALERVRVEGRPQVRLLTGAEGSGRRRLSQWLAETAAENGLAEVIYEPRDASRALALAERGPLVVCMGLLDPLSEQLLATLAFSRRPVMCVAAGSAEDWPDLPLVPGFAELRLDAMGPAAFRDLLETELGVSGPMAVRMGRRCHHLPGVAVAWLEELAAREVLVGTPAGFDAPPDDLGAPPEPSFDLAIARLFDGLPAEERRALALAAALGDRVYGEEWFALLASLSLSIPHAALHALLRDRRIHRHADGFSWASPTIRDAAAEPLDPSDHRAIVALLDALPETDRRRFRRGVHLLGAGEVARGRRILLDFDSADSVESMEFVRESVDALRDHMDGASPEERVRFLTANLRVHLNLISGPAAVPVARAVLQDLGLPPSPRPAFASADPEVLATAWKLIAYVLAFAELHEEVAPILEGLPESEVTLRCAALRATDEGELDQAQALLRRAIGMTDNPAQQGRLANGMGVAFGLAGDHERAAEWFQITVDHIEPDQRYTPLGNRALSLLHLGRYAEALRDAREAFDNAQHRGAHRVAFAVLMYAMAAAFVDEDELQRVADQALFSVRRYRLDDHGGMFTEVLDRLRPRRAATAEWVEALRFAFDEVRSKA